MKTITPAEAFAIPEDADNLPFRVLNNSGKMRVIEWVNAAARRPESHKIEAWFDDAEDAANECVPGESVIIEMSQFDTASGHTETLMIDDTDFVWMVNK